MPSLPAEQHTLTIVISLELFSEEEQVNEAGEKEREVGRGLRHLNPRAGLRGVPMMSARVMRSGGGTK